MKTDDRSFAEEVQAGADNALPINFEELVIEGLAAILQNKVSPHLAKSNMQCFLHSVTEWRKHYGRK